MSTDNTLTFPPGVSPTSGVKLAALINRGSFPVLSFVSGVTYPDLYCGKQKVGPWEAGFYLDPAAPPLVFGADGVATWGTQTAEWDARIWDEEWARTGDSRPSFRVKVKKILDLPRIEAQRWRIGLLKQRLQTIHAASIAAIVALNKPLLGDWNGYTLCCRPYGDSFMTSSPKGDEVVRDDLVETYYRSLLKMWYAAKALTNASAALHLALLRHLPLPVEAGKMAEVVVNGRSYWMVAAREGEEAYGGSYRVWERLAWPEQDQVKVLV